VVRAEREDVGRKLRAVVEPYTEGPERRDVLGGHDADVCTVHADDRPGADAVHRTAVGQDHDSTVAAAHGGMRHARRQEGKGEAQGAHKHPRGGRHRFWFSLWEK